MSAHMEIESLEGRTLMSTGSLGTDVLGQTTALWSVNASGGDLKFVTKEAYYNIRLFPLGNTLYELANNSLWKTDGTASGTSLIVASFGQTNRVLTAGVADGYLYYSVESYSSADDKDYGHVFRADSTGQVTRLNLPDGGVAVMIAGGKAYATVGSATYDLSDGGYIISGTIPPPDPTPTAATSVDTSAGRVYAYDDGVHGSELWADTGNGGHLAQDIFPGASASSPHNLVYFNGRVYFLASVPVLQDSASIVGGALLIGGVDEDENLTVVSQGGITTVSLAFTGSDRVSTFNDADFSQILIKGGDKDDQITVSGTDKPLIVFGGAGNDEIILTSDTTSPATLIGGEGNDTLIGDGNDLLNGSLGNITVSDLSNPAPATPPAPVAPAPTLSNGILTVSGTVNADRITAICKNGTVLEIVVNGKISNFTFSDVKKISVNASNGNDWINLKDINIGATLLGGNGNDSIYGSQGADSIDGGRGNDSICGFAGNDSITGGIGIDFIRGGEGTDRILASIGIDNTAKNKGDRLINQILA